MIARRWVGRIRTADEGTYVPYVEKTGAQDAADTDGNLGFQIHLRRHADGTTTIVFLSWWRDLDAVRAFAGDDHERARLYAEDEGFLVGMDETVEHFEVVADHRRPG
jgi:heme-degrading monooxygenase HmoA